jgi:hypothetical protein
MSLVDAPPLVVVPKKIYAHGEVTIDGAHKYCRVADVFCPNWHCHKQICDDTLAKAGNLTAWLRRR